jgi:NADH dehydrogenase/NADH:ubiquinone oxidoreductase subunit G
MEVKTESAALRRIRKNLISLLLSNHPNDCMICEKSGDCPLQELAYEYGVDGSRFEGEKWNLPIREDNPFITYEPNKCILCEGPGASDEEGEDNLLLLRHRL